MISVRYGAVASQSSKRISNSSATGANAARSASTSVGPGTSKSMRMKKRPVSRSPNCWLSTMLPPRATRKPDTACTMPGRSGQERMRT